LSLPFFVEFITAGEVVDAIRLKVLSTALKAAFLAFSAAVF
jgi:hypothetical protein